MRHHHQPLAARVRGAALGVTTAIIATGVATSPAVARDRPMTAPTQAKLRRALDTTLTQTRTPGAIVGVWTPGHGWTAVRGTSRAGTRNRPTRGDHTRIGSVTKTFTGTVILQLAAEGKLGLDDPIARWFPQLPDADAITVRELASMSSGINSYTVDSTVTDRYLSAPQTVWTPAELIVAGVRAPRKFTPGNGFFYSNTNFLMLGQIIEQVTGQSVAEAFQQRIFTPLGMRHTSYPLTTAMPAPFWHGTTQQNVSGSATRDATHWSPTFAGAAGEIVSTLGDLHRYTTALGTGALVTPAMQAQRLIPNPASVSGARAYTFALGTDNGWLMHSGEIPGYNTEVGYLPSLQATIVVLTNTDIPNPNGGAPAPTLFAALAGVIAPNNVP